MPKRYTPEQHAFFKRYIPGHTYEKVARQFNKKWPDRPITEIMAKQYAHNHGMVNGLRGHSKGRYTPEQIKWLKKYIPGHHHEEVAKAFNQKWPDAKPMTAIASSSFATLHGVKTGFTGRFEKGCTNGKECGFKKGHSRGIEHRYKAGHKPMNWCPVGTVRTRHYKDPDRRSETFIKIAEPNKWQSYSRWLWEQEHGPIPKGHFIAFRDGDHENFSIDNLRLMPMGALGTLANHADIRGEARDVLLTIGEIRTAVNARRKNGTD